MTRSNATLLLGGLLCSAGMAHCQVNEEHLAGPDKGEHEPARQEHFFGDWGGARSRLLERGVKLDLLYAGDQLWNAKSVQPERLAVWTRARGTVDWDLGREVRVSDLHLHVTAVWQGGGNLGNYLGTTSGPSGIASENTFRLDSWWLEKRLFQERVALRAGQFAAQDTYGEQFYGGSYVFEPFQYGLGNRGAVDESFDPPSTSAAEVRALPLSRVYIKAIVFSADPLPYKHNHTGLVPQFRGNPGSAYEVGFVPGSRYSALKPQDTVESRRGYSGLYRIGAAVNPGKFDSTSGARPVAGDYLIYGSANQAVFREDTLSDKGVDLAFSVDWTPPDRTVANQDLDVGLRFNEPLPIRRHNTVGIAWVRSGLSGSATTTTPNGAEDAFEANVLLDLPRGVLLQPVAQYYLHAGGRDENVLVVGFHTKLDF
jgi:porin